MTNITRDYVIVGNTNVNKKYNKVPEVNIPQELIYTKHMSGVCNFFIILKPFMTGVDLDLGVRKPSGEIFHITPQFVGISENSEYLYEVNLKDEQKDEIGKYEFELQYVQGTTKQTVFQGTYRVKDCI